MTKPNKPEEKIKSVKEKFRDDPKKRAEWFQKQRGITLQEKTEKKDTPPKKPAPPAPK